MKNISLIKYLFPLLIFTNYAEANHGPSTSGGGSTTESGETSKKDKFTFSFRETYTNYKGFSTADAIENAERAGEFDGLSDAFSSDFIAAYGVTDDFQIDGVLGWYSGRGFVNVHAQQDGEHEKSGGGEGEHDEAESSGPALGDPEGLSDLTIRAKYRLMKGSSGHLSVIGGWVFPVGSNDETLSNGEKLEPSSQPGSGRHSTLGGLAYSKYLTTNLSLDVSLIYTYRFEKDDFQIGSRLDSGIALAYRFTDLNEDTFQYSMFTEINHQYIGKDEGEETNQNSGGDTIYFTPGVKMSLGQDYGLIVAPSFPIYQNLNGIQLQTDYRIISQAFARF